MSSETHFLYGEIASDNAMSCVEWLTTTPGKPSTTLTLYINSIGGDLFSAFAVIDAIHLRAAVGHGAVRVVATGSAMSSAFMILASGTPGQRMATMNTTLMCHEYSDIFEGSHTSLTTTLEECRRTNGRMSAMLAATTRVPPELVESVFLGPIDHYFDVDKALTLGVIDHVWSHNYSR